jgi:hypothetical protein
LAAFEMPTSFGFVALAPLKAGGSMPIQEEERRTVRRLVVMARTQGGDLIATYGDVLVVSYVSPSMVEAAAELIEVADAELAAGPRAVLSCIHAGVRASAGPNRERLAALLAKHRERILGVATVVRGTGFRAAGVRGLIASVRRGSGGGYPSGTFTEAGAAVAWLAARVPDLDAGALADLVRTFEPLSDSA